MIPLDEEGLEVVKEIYNTVESTHRGLGNMAVFLSVASKADIAVLNVGLSGTGKSVTTNSLLKSCGRNSMLHGELTKASLAGYGDRLNSFTGVIVVDDLARADSEYILMSTVKTLIELAYAHGVEKQTYRYKISLSNFYASVIMNVQPIMLAKVMRESDWDAFIRDKCIRYYHLYRPIEPRVNEVTIPKLNSRYYEDSSFTPAMIDKSLFTELVKYLNATHTESRAIEFAIRLVRASAALNERNVVTNSDVMLIRELMKQSLVERSCTSATDFEGTRKFDYNLYAILTEFCTTGKPIQLTDLMARYGYKRSTIYWILSRKLSDYVTLVNTPSKIYPTPELNAILQELGVFISV